MSGMLRLLHGVAIHVHECILGLVLKDQYILLSNCTLEEELFARIGALAPKRLS